MNGAQPVTEFDFDYPFRPAQVVEFFRCNYGPMTRAVASLDEQTQEALRGELVRLWMIHNRAKGNRTLVDAEYLEVVATRARAATHSNYAGAA